MPTSKIRFVALLLLVLPSLQGCLLLEPGMHMPYFGNKIDWFSEEVVFKENGEIRVGKQLIKPITAELIANTSGPSLYEGMEKDGKSKGMTYYQYRLGLAVRGPKNFDYYEYRIGPRDVLNITVWEHPELTIPQGQFRSAEQSGTVVKEDGTIFYPYAGVIKAAGMTREELRQELTDRLSGYIEKPQLEVQIAAFRSQRVFVVGEVRQPGRVSITDIPLTAMEAINRPAPAQTGPNASVVAAGVGAGGITTEANLRDVTLTRDGKTYRLDLQALYEAGDLSQDVLLKDGDVLNVPNRAFDKVFVMGELKTPQALAMSNGRMTLSEALGLAGGVDNTASNPRRIFVIRGTRGQPEIFSLDARAPDAFLLSDEFLLRPHDVVFVDTAEITRWNRFITQIAPTISMMQTMGATAIPLYSARPLGSLPQ